IRSNPALIDHQLQHLRSPDDGKLPVARKLGGMLRDVVRIAFDPDIIVNTVCDLTDGHESRYGFALNPGAARVKEHGIHQADNDTALLNAYGDFILKIFC